MKPVLYSLASAVKRRLSESFNKPDHVDLGPDLHWVLMEGDWQVRSNAAEAIGTALNYAVPDVDITGHHRATITVTSLVAGPGVVVRAANTDSDGYLGRVLWDGKWELHKIVGGVVTLLASTTGAVPSTPVDLTLSVAGSRLTLEHNGVSKLTVTDTSLGASRKKVGIRAFGAGDRIDQLVAENIRPSVQVRVALDTDPLAPPVWTDLSDRASQLQVTTGREQELDAFRPGTLSGVLDNSDRALDTLHTTGPYYGKLKPRKRINARAVFGDTAYDVGSGYAHGWPQSYSHPEGSATDVSATDAFLLLAGAELPSSVYALEVAKDNPHAWWRLGETEGSRALDSSGNRYDGTYVGGATFNTRTGLTFGDDDNAIEFSATQSMGSVSAGLENSQFTIEFWLQVTSEQKPTGTGFIYAQGDGRLTRVSMRSDGTISAQFRGDGVATSMAFADGQKHHVVVFANSDSLQIYVDKVERAFRARTLGTLPQRGPVYIAPSVWAGKFTGILDEIATYEHALPLSRIVAHYDAGTKPWDGDTTGARVNRVLDLVGWPAGERSVDTGNSTLGPAALSRRKALDYLQLVERTEQGALYVEPDNKIRFRERRARFYDARMTTPQLTLTDEDYPSALHYEGNLALTYDENLIHNEVTVRWDGGEVTVSDDASIATYGRKTHPVETIARTADDARWIAEWVVDHYKDPQIRVPSVTINPGVDAQLWDAALSSRIGDRIGLRRFPQGIGDPFTLEAHVEGKEHVMAETPEGSVWTTTLPLSVATTKQYWILGTSALGVDTYLGY